MNREAFEELLNNAIKSAEGIGYSHGCGYFGKIDANDEKDVAEEKLLAEFDRLTAEVERMRWHYPERGELPPVAGAEAWEEEIFIETKYKRTTARLAQAYLDDPLSEPNLLRWRQLHYCGADAPLYGVNDIVRWRYIDDEVTQ